MKKFLQTVSLMLAITLWALTPLIGQSTCEKPTGLNVTDITTNSAQVTWVTEDTVEMQWYVFVYPTYEGSAYGWETFTSTDTVTLTDLLPNTNYTVLVQTYCGEDLLGESLYSEWSDTYSFMTECGVLSVTPENTYSIVFESDDLHCWSWDAIAGNSGWYIGNNGYFFGNEYGSSNANDSARLLSPFFDLTQMERPRLNFYFLRDVNHDISAYYRTGVNAEWILLADYPYEGNGSWESATLRLPNVDSCQLSFVATGTTSGYRSVQMGSLLIYEYPSCVAPTELTVVNFPAANQVTLSWTDLNDTRPESWTVYVTDNYGFEVEQIVTDTFVTVENLDIEVWYDWKVKANCSENAEWTNGTSFYTSCGMIVVTPENPYQMGFESYATCWPSNESWWRNSYSPHSGNVSVVMRNGEMESPFFDLSRMENPMLSFYHKRYTAGEDTILSVYYRTSEGAELQLLAQYAPGLEYSIEMLPLPDTCQIVFRYITDEYLFLDDIAIYERPTCLTPGQFAVDTIGLQFVTLSWTAAGEEREWTLRVEGWGDTVVSSNPVTINGLHPSTYYNVSVRANCSATDSSDWNGPITFRTDCDAFTVDVDNIFFEGFEDYSTFDVPVCWLVAENNNYGPFVNANHTPFTGQKCLQMGVAEGTQSVLCTKEFTNDIKTLQVSLSAHPEFYYGGTVLFEIGVWQGDTMFVPVKEYALTESNNYDFTVFFNHYEGNGSRIAFRMPIQNQNYLYIDDITVALIPACLVPTDVTVYGVTKDSAVVTWSHDTIQNPASWTVRLFDGYTYRDTTVTTDTVIFSDLAFGTEYMVQVRANCNATDTSDWSEEVFFATDCDVYVVTPENPYVDDFEVAPVCWGGYVYWYEDYAYSGEYGIATDDELITPVLDLSALENPTLSFYHKYYGMKIYYKTRESGFWLLLADFDYSDDFVYEVLGLPSPTETYQIKFSLDEGYFYMDDVMVSEMLECAMPSRIVLDSITDTSVQIGWTANGSETSWTISLNGEETVVTENPVTIRNLEPGVQYTVKVRANCTDTTFSDWSEERTVVLDCSDLFVVTDNQPYHEGFENYRVCWSVSYYSNGQYWSIADTTYTGAEYAYEGARFAVSPDSEEGQSLLYTCELDITQVTNPQLSFQARVLAESDTVSELMVLYRTSDTTAWQPLMVCNNLTTTYSRTVVNLPQATGTYRVAFMSRNGGQRFLVDDVNIYNMPACEEPTNVTVENNVVTWTGNAPSYNVKVSVNGVVVDEANVTTNTYTVEGLSEGTLAIVRVQAVCDEANLSDWTEGNVVVPVTIGSYELNATVYPNPTTGVVNIEGATLNADIAVFDMFGKQLMTGKVASERTELDLSGLASGIYIIRIANADAVSTIKVVKE